MTMWREQKVVVVFPTYNEKDSIRAAIEDFFSSSYVDEIIVVNNNAAPGTKEEVEKTRAIQVFESKQGYGHAIQRGVQEALQLGADLIIISEPDGTFAGHDCMKLLAYSDDFPVVFGTRTAETLIWDGANMGWFLKWGNFAVAKMMELLFNTNELSDVGCTMRCLHRSVLSGLQPLFTVGGSHFGPELMMLVISHQIPFVEIPLNYKQRVGESSVTGDFWKAWRLGWRMIFMIIGTRIRTWLRPYDPNGIELDFKRHKGAL